MTMHARSNTLVENRPPHSVSAVCSPQDDGICWYDNEIPAFAEKELERLYGSIFCSLAHYRIYGGAENASTYVARDGDKPVAILLFRFNGRELRVVNEWFRLERAQLIRFTHLAFNRYSAVDRISWHALDIGTAPYPFPAQRHPCTNNSMVTLPTSAEAYLAQLGKPTRKNIRRYQARLAKHFPGFRYHISERGDIDERQVRRIIEFNRIRMARKNKVSGVDAREADRMVRLLKERGFVGIATIDGEVCAGALVYRIGDHYYSFVRAHDPHYDAYRLGLVGGYLLAAECIARGGKTLHFMWGGEKHKALLHGEQKDLYHLTLYRSRLHYLLNSPAILKNAISVRLHGLRLWLLAALRR